MWFKWTGMLMELLFGPPLEDEDERDLTDDEAENLIEEADDYGIYSDYYERKRGPADRVGEIKSGHDH